jgi:DNA polymerase
VEASSELEDFLDLLEDYLTDGFRRDQEELEERAGRVGHAVPRPTAAAEGGTARAERGTAPPTTGAGPEAQALELARVAEEVSRCTRCPLARSRNRPVAGQGPLQPLVLIVGEGPGAEEDRTGRPFVGRAGQYLDRWLSAVVVGKGGVALDRGTNTYITNVVKCRPPGNRDPSAEEIAACLPYLERQVDALAPRAILSLGRVALHTLTGRTESLGALRGRLYSYRNVPLIPTYHPSAVLRDITHSGRQARTRAYVWEDLKRLKALLEYEPLR